MHRLALICVLSLTNFAPLWASDIFVLQYEKTNKWLAQTKKAPLLSVRQKMETHKKRHLFVTLPKENRALSLARLNIIAEVIGRNVPDLLLEETTENPTKPNTLRLTLP